MVISIVGVVTVIIIILVVSKGDMMRDKYRLFKFYEELREIHMKYFPDWRFGQMISNVLVDWRFKTGRDIFFPEEDEMIQIFKDYIKENGYDKKDNPS